MDDVRAETVTEVFVRLFEQGLIYRGKRLVNWDPVLGTAVSDLEVESVEEQGSMWHIRYPLADNPAEAVIVATTRPETLLGDVAVAVNPEDERYTHLIDKGINPAADRPHHPRDCRRIRRKRLRYRLRENHACARLQRLRSRQTPRHAPD